MKYTLVGLGNPGTEYVHSPHNIGREIVETFVKSIDKKAEWKLNAKAKARTTMVEAGGATVVCVLPETFMNNSGMAVAALVMGASQCARTIVVHDDLDLPLGTLKLSFNRGSGGHNGVKSVTAHLKTDAYIRLRVGVSPRTSKGVIKKPHGEEAVIAYILKPFAKKYADDISRVYQYAHKMLCAVCEYGVEKAMTEYN